MYIIGPAPAASIPGNGNSEKEGRSFSVAHASCCVTTTPNPRLALVDGAAQDLLSVRTTDGRDALVPFVSALVPEVDLEAGRVVVADRPGLVSPFPDEQDAGTDS